MMKKFFLSCLFLCVSSQLFAEDMLVDGIAYRTPKFIAGANTCEVVRNGTDKYKGVIHIPATIVYKGNTYNVTAIGNSAFEDCTSLTEITLPNSIENIGQYAFSHCSNLSHISLPESLKSIRACAFEYCSKLSQMTIPNGVKSISYRAFIIVLA